MPTICFASNEIHPTTPGGCGVLIYNAAAMLLERGYRVIFLLDLPPADMLAFRDRDRLKLPHADRCVAYCVEDLLADCPFKAEEFIDQPQWVSLRYAFAWEALAQRESIDYVEFFDYFGPAFYTLSRTLYADTPPPAVLSVRLHSPLELIDRMGATTEISRFRYRQWAFERGSLRLAESVLTPTRTFFDASFGDYRLDPRKVMVSQPPKRPLPQVSRRPSASGNFRVMFLGRLFHLKGVDQFVHAAVMLLREHPDLRCTFDLIGYDSNASPYGGKYADFLRASIPPALRGRFEFLGHQSHAQIAERLNETLFAVFPTRIESFCYALHEVYDAGVPVIANRLPAFRDFFEHERNVLYYDGTTHALLSQMRRMIDDAPLRERLCKPVAVGQQPLGEMYDQPRAGVRVFDPSHTHMPIRPLIVLLADGDARETDATIAALHAQTLREFDLAILSPATAADAESMPLLGKAWRISDSARASLSTTELLTGDALALLRGGDVPQPHWLATCVRALQRRDDLAFAGTWSRVGETLRPSLLDATPELWPFECGAALTRCLIRTQAGEPLADLFDTNLGGLAEIGVVWDAIARWGIGRLLPEVALTVALRDQAFMPANPNALMNLVTSRGAIFADRLALWSGIRHAEIAADHTQGARSLAEQVTNPAFQVEVANRLNGTTLAKLAARKLARKLGMRRRDPL